MKKKAYISPETEVVNVKIENLMDWTVSAGSDNIQSSDEDDNSEDPNRSRRRNVWEDEEEW